MPSPDTERLSGRLRGVLEPVVAAAGFELDAVEVRAAGRRHAVTVVVDRPDDGGPTGVGLDDVAQLSRSAAARAGPPRAPDRRLVHAGGHLAGRGPAADQPAALAPRAPAPGRDQPHRRDRAHGPGRRGGRGVGRPAGRREERELRDARLREIDPRRRSRWSSRSAAAAEVDLLDPAAATRERGGGPMNVDIAGAARHRAGEGHPVRDRHRGHRDGAADRLQAHRRPPGARPDRHRPQDRAGPGDGPETRRGRHSTTEWDDTPEGFGRIAATTARQVILQRLRDAEHERTYGEFAAKEGEIVAGVVQRDARANARGVVIVQLRRQTEGVLPQAEQVPGETYRARRAACAATSSASRAGCAAPRSR